MLGTSFGDDVVDDEELHELMLMDVKRFLRPDIRNITSTLISQDMFVTVHDGVTGA